jgi:hypothetical protein
MLIIEYKMTTIGKNIAKVYSIKNAMNIQANRFMLDGGQQRYTIHE